MVGMIMAVQSGLRGLTGSPRNHPLSHHIHLSLLPASPLDSMGDRWVAFENPTAAETDLQAMLSNGIYM